MKNLTKCNVLNTFALKNNEKFAHHSLEKMCPWFLASTIPVLGARMSVLEKSVVGLGLGFFRVFGLDLEGCVLDSTSANYPIDLSTDD